MIDRIKRRYADLRWGYAQVSLFIGLANFLLLAYNFTNAKDILNFNLFVSISAISFSILFIIVGQFFRKQQMATDHDMGFEHDPLHAKTYRMVLEQLPRTIETSEFIEYLKKIENKTLHETAKKIN